MLKTSRSKIQKDYPWSHLVDSIFTRDKKFNRRNGQLENRLIRVHLKVKQIPEHMSVLEEIFSSFGLKTSDLEEAEPKPKEIIEPITQIIDVLQKGALETAIISRRSHQLEERLSQLDPNSEDAAKLKGLLTFYTDHYRTNLKFTLKDITNYPNSSEELQTILYAIGKNTNSSTEEPTNQILPTSEEVSMEVSEESQNESSSTEETYKLPPKRLTCRDQTQDPKTPEPEISNQYTSLSNMNTENSEAIPEQKKHILPFFVIPNDSYPDTCKFLTSSVESLNISVSTRHFLKLTVNSEKTTKP
ncbi:hypothetical protein CDAR_302131 [Caerostris darwini]|uniref:Uncharacterized protein n=1 Tax=Caerostris darwini TaxID=1538125 RepID=A0AAV4SLJ2_9ARAC|nr:hypothetical protein CDAR_302131 [Caerostris darwini]